MIKIKCPRCKEIIPIVIKMTQDYSLYCEECGSYDTYFRKKDRKKVCKRCGFSSQIKMEEKRW